MNDYNVFLCKQGEPFLDISVDEKMEFAEKTILDVIKLFTESILIFYELDD